MMAVAETVYMVCTIASLACAVLLLRSYRRTHLPLILWTSLCFVAFAANNVVLFIDLVLTPPTLDLILVRLTFALVGVALLLYGLIREAT
jgi:hypothetical protein